MKGEYQPYLGKYRKICSELRLYELSINRTETEDQTENLTALLADFSATGIQAFLVPFPIGTDTSKSVLYFFI